MAGAGLQGLERPAARHPQVSGMFDDQYNDARLMAPQPLDLRASFGEPAEFPVEALSKILREAVHAIEQIVQVPMALAAQSVLAATSLATQSYINVETIIGQSCPTSLFFFTVASSGDRKSTADRIAMKPAKDREERMALKYELDRHRYAIDDAAYKAAHAKAKSSGKDRRTIAAAMEEVGRPPVQPVLPLLTVDEPTGPGLQRAFAEAMPSLGLFSDEGAAFLGGWSMQDENQSSTGAMLSKLWDGAPIKRIRADKDAPTQILHGRRLALHLMVQVDVAGKLLGNKAVRDQGLLSRMLIAAPKSRKGSRLFREPTPSDRAAVDAFQQKLGRRLESPMRFRDETSRALDCSLVRLTPEARTILIQFSDHCETQLRPNGSYEQISDFASKMTENATRMAAVLAFFEGGQKVVDSGLSGQAAMAGIKIMEFYASEAARLYGAAALDDDVASAATLIEWIRKRDLNAIGARFLQRGGPPVTRNGPVLKRALATLEEFGHLKRIKDGAHIDHGKGEKFYAEAYTVVPVGAE